MLYSCHCYPLYMAVWATKVELYVGSVTVCQHSQLNMYVLIMFNIYISVIPSGGLFESG